MEQTTELNFQQALEALKNGLGDAEDMRREYERRRNFIHGALNEMGLPCHLPQGAFYVFPCIGKYGLTSKQFAHKLLDEESVACVPGDAFGQSGEGYLRCAYAAELEDIKEAMRRMAAFVQRLAQG